MQRFSAVANSPGLPAFAAVPAWFGWSCPKDVRDGIKEVKTEWKGKIPELTNGVGELKNILIENNLAQTLRYRLFAAIAAVFPPDPMEPLFFFAISNIPSCRRIHIPTLACS